MEVGKEARVRELVTMDVADGNGDVQLTLGATAKGHKDRVTRSTKVVPRGFPFELYASGLLK